MIKMESSTTPQFILCIKNDDYPASLELRKLYRRLPDAGAAARHFVRVIDESGEDYLYPEGYFVALDLPTPVEEILLQVSP
jgi:hypothetical protein